MDFTIMDFVTELFPEREFQESYGSRAKWEAIAHKAEAQGKYDIAEAAYERAEQEAAV